MAGKVDWVFITLSDEAREQVESILQDAYKAATGRTLPAKVSIGTSSLRKGTFVIDPDQLPGDVVAKLRANKAAADAAKASADKAAKAAKAAREPDSRVAPVAGKPTPGMSAKQEVAADAWWKKVQAGNLTLPQLEAKLKAHGAAGLAIYQRVAALAADAEDVPMPEEDDDVPMPEEEEVPQAKAAAPKPDAAAVDPITRVLDALDGMSDRLDALGERVGAMEGKAPTGRAGKRKAA